MMIANGCDAAGIGCGRMGETGTITIESGTVNAQGGPRGAGIGSGVNDADADDGVLLIDIKGGTVTATGDTETMNPGDSITMADNATVKATWEEHDWDEPTYEWAADNSAVTAKRVCRNDASHVETETVDTVSEVADPLGAILSGAKPQDSAAEEEAASSQGMILQNRPPVSCGRLDRDAVDLDGAARTVLSAAEPSAGIALRLDAATPG